MFGLPASISSTIASIVGGALAAGVMLAWAVFVYGPAQYEAGGLATAARLDAATNIALKELSDEADRHDFLRRQCIARGGLYDFSAGECIEEPAL